MANVQNADFRQTLTSTLTPTQNPNTQMSYVGILDVQPFARLLLTSSDY